MQRFLATLLALLLATSASADQFDGLYGSIGPVAESGTFTFGLRLDGIETEVTSFNVSGESLEVCGGYRYQLGQSGFTAGAELCGYRGTVEGSRLYAVEHKGETASLLFRATSEQEYAARLQLGYLVTDALLVEVSAGWMAAEFSVEGTAAYNGDPTSYLDSGWATGTTRGVHATYALTDRVALTLGVDTITYEGGERKDWFSFPVETVAHQDTTQVSFKITTLW